MKMILALMILGMASSAVLATDNNSCQGDATGFPGPFTISNGTETKTNGLCVSCASDSPITGTVTNVLYNLNPDRTNASCNSTTQYNKQFWQLTAHIAGYSGDGIHTASNPPDLTHGGQWDCTDGGRYDYTQYPGINTNKTTWNSYDQTNYPPAELGHYTSPAPNPNECSKVTGVGPCARWSQWELETNGPLNGNGNGSYSSMRYSETADSDNEDYERDDIGFNSINNGVTWTEDSILGANEGVGNDDVTNTQQLNFQCDNQLNSAMNWKGDSVAPIANFLPLVVPNPPGTWPYHITSPGQIYCAMSFGDATISSSTWSPSSTADANGAFPIQLDATFQTNCCQTVHELDNQFLADIYITHSGGAKAWPTCVVEYDARLNPE